MKLKPSTILAIFATIAAVVALVFTVLPLLPGSIVGKWEWEGKTYEFFEDGTASMGDSAQSAKWVLDGDRLRVSISSPFGGEFMIKFREMDIGQKEMTGVREKYILMGDEYPDQEMTWIRVE